MFAEAEGHRFSAELVIHQSPEHAIDQADGFGVQIGFGGIQQAVGQVLVTFGEPFESAVGMGQVSDRAGIVGFLSDINIVPGSFRLGVFHRFF